VLALNATKWLASPQYDAIHPIVYTELHK